MCFCMTTELLLIDKSIRYRFLCKQQWDQLHRGMDGLKGVLKIKRWEGANGEHEKMKAAEVGAAVGRGNGTSRVHTGWYKDKIPLTE